jgi:calcineurin-like phosphoesterase
MRLLITGQLVGEQAMRDVCAALPDLRALHRIDLVISIADNIAITGPSPRDGSGMTVSQRNALLDGGVDLILTGTHVWDGGHGHAAVDHPRVVRCANLINDALLPGRGRANLRIGDEHITVLQLADSTAPGCVVRSAYEAWQGARAPAVTVVHLLGTPYSAMRFAHAVDGRCAAVIGSLTHVASRDLQILPHGTAFVADIGYVGPAGGVGGFDPSHFVAEYVEGDATALPPYRLRSGPTQFSAVLLEVTPNGTVAEFGWLLSLDPTVPAVPMCSAWDLRTAPQPSTNG